MDNKASLPSLFVSHGAPDILLTRDPNHLSFEDLTGLVPGTEAIVIISAHWIDEPVGITDMQELDTIHDFGGFASELYQIRYPARGDAGLSRRVAELLRKKGFESELYRDRGLDHGAWVPLKLMYPQADKAVVQVSLPMVSLDQLVKFGEALKPLRNEAVLIIGSGGSVHNLRALRASGPPEPWVVEFEHWLQGVIEGNRIDDLITAASLPENFRRAHPTIEHYAPIIVAWAAGDRHQAGKCLHRGYSHGNLGISHYAFGLDDMSMPSQPV